MQEKLKVIVSECIKEADACVKEADLLVVKSKYLGKKSELFSLLSSLKDMSIEDKKKYGGLFNKIKGELEGKINKRLEEINSKSNISFDDTLPVTLENGSLHPITLVGKEVTDILTNTLTSDNDEILVGEEIVFNEIDEDIEIKAKGLKNMVIYKYKDKDIYIFDNHNHAFYFWIKSLEKGNFTKGCKLVHVDQHKDTREPENYNVDISDTEDVFRYTNEVLNVGSFIKPALHHNIFSDVIIIDSSYGFDIDIEEEFVLDIDLDIFSKDMDYIPHELKISKRRYRRINKYL